LMYRFPQTNSALARSMFTVATSSHTAPPRSLRLCRPATAPTRL
jgi:hypothetical protein